MSDWQSRAKPVDAAAPTALPPVTPLGDWLARAKEAPSQGEAAFDHAIHGGMAKFSDEVVGLGHAIGNKTARLLAPNAQPGDFMYGAPGTFGELYNAGRDKQRGRLAAESADWPKTSGASEVGGALLPLLVPGLGELAATRAGAATFGGVQAGLQSMGDQPEGVNPAKTLKDTATGALLGRGGYELGAAAGPLANALREKALEYGRKVLVAGKQSLTRGRIGVSPEAVQEVLDSGAIIPGGTSKGTLERILPELEMAGQKYGDTVETLGKAGVTGANAHQVAQDLAAEAKTFPLQTVSPRAGMFRNVARDLYSEPVDAAGNMSLTRNEAVKRELQQIAKSEYDKLQHLQTPRGEAAEALASRLRQASEDAIERQAGGLPQRMGGLVPDTVSDAAAQFVPAKQQYGRLAEATNALREGVGQAQRRGGPNLVDAVKTGALVSKYGPLAAMAKPAIAAWRERGPSTMAWLDNALAPAVEKIGPGLTSRVGWAADDPIQALIAALQAQKDQK